MEQPDTGLMAHLAEKHKANLWVLYDAALTSARKDLDSDNPQARAAAEEFLERAAARKTPQAAQAKAGHYPLAVVLVFQKAKGQRAAGWKRSGQRSIKTGDRD
ncbi:MAG: hypothetical protein AAB654_08940 [Acidobacteriota bacterium]